MRSGVFGFSAFRVRVEGFRALGFRGLGFRVFGPFGV